MLAVELRKHHEAHSEKYTHFGNPNSGKTKLAVSSRALGYTHLAQKTQFVDFQVGIYQHFSKGGPLSEHGMPRRKKPRTEPSNRVCKIEYTI